MATPAAPAPSGGGLSGLAGDTVSVGGHKVPVALLGLVVSVIGLWFVIRQHNAPARGSSSSGLPLSGNPPGYDPSALSALQGAVSALQGQAATQSVGQSILGLSSGPASISDPSRGRGPLGIASFGASPPSAQSVTPAAPAPPWGSTYTVSDPGWSGLGEIYYVPGPGQYLNEIAAKFGLTPQALLAISPTLRANRFPTPGTPEYIGSVRYGIGH